MKGVTMSKTAPILDQTHALIVNKQKELKKKYRVTMKISDIIDVLVTKNIHKLENFMGMNIEKEKIVNSDDMKDNIKSPGKDIVVSGAVQMDDKQKSNIKH
jgi:DNA-binding Lrp family transcriptional regulator